MSNHLKIPVSQLNLHKSKVATSSLGRDLSKIQTHISLLQEPNTFKNKVVGFGKYEVYNGGRTNERPLACIVTSPNIISWQMAEFSDADCVAIRTSWDGLGTVIFASV